MPTNSPLAGGAAADDLGLGSQLGQQVQDESDEERKKRLLQMQQQSLLGPAGSLAVTSIFGGKSAAGN